MEIDWIEKAKNLQLSVRDFVAGRRREACGEVIDKYGPRDGGLLCQFRASEGQDVEQAVAQARQAFEDGRWSQQPVQRRKNALYQLAALIEKHSDELALLECLDVGKPIQDALTLDVPAAAALIRFNAECADKLYGPVYAADASSLSYELQRPMGVVAGIVGWNYPLFLAAQKIGPALATGNSLVLKPSELTSFSAVRLAELALEAGVPEGVFNVIHGAGRVGAALARHPGVDLISFTGSTRTGKGLMVAAGESNLKRVILECGGKAPSLVFEDSPDLEAVAAAIAHSACRNQGEVCVASSRVLVQKSIRNQFIPLLVEKVSQITLGDPLRAQTRFGAVVSRGHQQRIGSYVNDGLEEGARIAYQCEAEFPHAGGFYVPPVIFTGVSSQQKIAQEEIFGPVLAVLEFHDESEAIRIANDTLYGLSAVLWTTDAARAHRVSHSIDAGWVAVNATAYPRGGPGLGVMAIGGHKQSGLGSEGGLQGLAEYTRKTAIQYFV